jgi:uncharacterized membrane protein YphA (DoxX/SURF4 family)
MPSKGALWTGRVLSTLPVLMLLFSGSMKFIPSDQTKQAFEHLGWPYSYALGLGILEIACTILYIIPRTAIVGAILLTGYMGGAIATHVRIGEPPILQVVFAVIIWLGLYLREPRLRALIPLRR